MSIPTKELHDALAAAHYDLYKEVYNVRPRWYRYSDMSVAELESAVLSLQEDVQEILEAAKQEEAEAREAVAQEAIRHHEERWMDRAAAMGAAGW